MRNEANIHDLRVKAVFGDMKASLRKKHMDWLGESTVPKNEARIITNVRCLSEGVDVPSLDAIVYLSPRTSEIDIVQSIGRVMRKAAGKKYGYIIIPVAVEGSLDINSQMRNKSYATVWKVLNALKSHDDRFDANIKQLTSNIKPDFIGKRILTGSDREQGDAIKNQDTRLPLNYEDSYSKWFIARLVRNIGNKYYWEDWAKDIADIVKSLRGEIEKEINLNSDKKEIFDELKHNLKNIIPSVNKDMTLTILSQHVVTQPVFKALFDNNEFIKQNPISLALEQFLKDFNNEKLLNIESDLKLKQFYQDVKDRVAGIDNQEARIKGLKYSDNRQTIIDELYENFFKKGFKDEADKHGIVTTPSEISNFIIHSVDEILKKEFGKKLSDKNVKIIDPFTGTGSFIRRLIDSGLLDENLEYKYHNDIWVNEILLLPYYIATINIENSYHQRIEAESYQPFLQSILVDTFQLYELMKNPKQSLQLEGYFQDISRQIKDQNAADFTVIIGNPPYRMGQKSANDDSKNQTYQSIDRDIKEKYTDTSVSKSNRSLYDSYVKALLWANKRNRKGVIGFVINGGWLESKAFDGFRKELCKDFNKVYVFDLKGNLRIISSELKKKEGGNVFDIQTSITFIFLIKKGLNDDCEFYYYDIEDNLKKQEKLAKIKDFNHLYNINWLKIPSPNKYGDLINRREDYPDCFHRLISIDKGIASKPPWFDFSLLGIVTSRDAWVYDFSKDKLAIKIRFMLDNYHKLSIDNDNETKISWSHNLKKYKNQSKEIIYDDSSYIQVMYRPFCVKFLYYQKDIIERPRPFKKIFPDKCTQNLTINLHVRLSDNRDCAGFITNMYSDIELLKNVRCLPRYYYDSNNLFNNSKIDAISDFILSKALQQYDSQDITKDDIFYYVYGFLHSKEYRETFAKNLAKDLPQIPLVDKSEDFIKFSQAGRQLAELHLNYDKYSSLANVDAVNDSNNYMVNKMSFKDKKDKSTIIFNQDIIIQNIPAKAYQYRLNGRSAIEWIMNQYQVKEDKKSKIILDPNDYAKEIGNPRYILDLLLSVIYISEKTIDIVDSLPKINWQSYSNNTD